MSLPATRVITLLRICPASQCCAGVKREEGDSFPLVSAVMADRFQSSKGWHEIGRSIASAPPTGKTFFQKVYNSHLCSTISLQASNAYSNPTRIDNAAFPCQAVAKTLEVEYDFESLVPSQLRYARSGVSRWMGVGV